MDGTIKKINKIKSYLQPKKASKKRLSVLKGRKDALLSDLYDDVAIMRRIEWYKRRITETRELLLRYELYMKEEENKLHDKGLLQEKLDKVNRQISDEMKGKVSFTADEVINLNKKVEAVTREFLRETGWTREQLNELKKERM